MPRQRKSDAKQSSYKHRKSNGANLGFEQTLWQAADKLRGYMDPGEYKHVVLGLIFLKYISDAFDERHAWRGEKIDPLPQDGREEKGEGAIGPDAYKDVPGFCKSASLDEIREHNYVLTPGRYVGAEALEEDDEPFDEKMQRLTATLEEQFQESAKLEKLIRNNQKTLGYGR